MSSRKPFHRILLLCLRSRCPVCAQGRLFVPLRRVDSLRSLCIPAEHCDRCGFVFRREPGYYFGVLTPVLPILSLATGVLFVIAYFLWTRSRQPLDLLLPGAIGILVGSVACLRPAIAIYLSLDHAVDPPGKSGALPGN